MEDKDLAHNVLGNIQYLASKGLVTREQVMGAFNAGAAGSVTPLSVDMPTISIPIEQGDVLKEKVTISDVLYGLGALTVIIGLVVLVTQNWDSLGSFGKIVVTLGSAVSAYVVGVIFSGYQNLFKVSQAFHIIGAVFMPVGLYVMFDVGGFDTGTAGFRILISSILLTVYGLSLWVFKQKIFLLFTLFWGTGLYYSLINAMVANMPPVDWLFKIYSYATLLSGAAYVFLASAFDKMKKDHFNGLLNFMGTLFVLGSAFSLVVSSTLWTILYPGLVFGMAFLSIQMKSKGMLSWSSIFLMGYMLYITGRYFADVLSWPVALMVAGLALIGIGYYAFSVGKKYIS